MVQEEVEEETVLQGGINKKVFREMSFFDYITTLSSSEKSQILNMVQYGGLSVIPLLVVLKFMKLYVPEEDPYKSSTEILIEVVLQLIVILVALFFIHKLVVYVPTYSNTEYEKVCLLTVILPLFFLMFTLDTKVSEKLNILFERLLVMIGLKKEGMEEAERVGGESTTRVVENSPHHHQPPPSLPQQHANPVLDNPTQRGMTDSMIPQGGGMQENMQVDMMNNVEPMASNAFGSPF